MEKHINELQLTAFKRHLRLEEREPTTIEKYLRDVHAFTAWLDGKPLDKEATVAWKGHLLVSGYAPSTVNPMLIAVNRFFRFQHWDELRVKTVWIQRKIFRSKEKELSREEYLRLLETADALGKPRLSLLMEVICATGIRVSEVKYITVEAARAGRAEMKAICKQSGVAPSKVFRHSLRHLFARTFYKSCRDMVQLADVLGHSSIETTRIYLVSTGTEYVRRMNRLGLILQLKYHEINKSTIIQKVRDPPRKKRRHVAAQRQNERNKKANFPKSAYFLCRF